MPTLVRLADYIADFIAAQGVDHVFLLPGGGAMHLIDAMGRCPKLAYVANLHEQASSIAAEAYARVNENIGVAVVTTGPGGLNAVTGVAGAWIESVPMLVVSGQVKRADRIGDSGVRQRGAQEADIVSVVRPITKYAVTVEDPQTIRWHLEKALHLARSGRKGPVWIDVPLDVQGSRIDPASLPGFEAAAEPATADGLSGQVAQVLSLIAAAERPLILAGHGIRLGGAADAFRQLAQRLQIPLVATWNAMDLLHFDHPLFVGKPGAVGLRAGNFAVQNCDLLVSLGARLDNVVTAYNPVGFAAHARKVVVDIDPHEMAKHAMPIDVAILADCARAVEEMLRQAAPAPHSRHAAWRERCQEWKQRWGSNDGKPMDETAPGPISHVLFASALSDELPEDQLIVTGSSGLGVEMFYSNYRVRRGQRVFLTSGLGAMGYGLPAAIGACLANGGRPMTLIESDGSLQLNVQELNTLTALNLPIRIFLMNNQGYASIRTTCRNYFDGRYVGTGPEAGLSLPDPVTMANAFGVPAMRIETAAGLRDGIRAMMAQTGPILCDVRLLPNEDLWPRVSAIPQPDGSMISMPLEDMTPLLPLDELAANMLVPLSPASVKARAV